MRMTQLQSGRLIVSLAMAGMLVTASGPRAQQPAKAEQEVRDAVKQIVAAYAENDIAKYFAFYAPDMTVLRATGRWTTQGYQDRWKQVVDGGGGVASADVVDLQVQVSPSGDSAVASYQMPVKPRYPNAEAAKGQATQIIYYMTDVYFRRNGQWKIVHLHWTVQPPPRA
jgi:ketosteroid isomerase-like protein